MISWLFTAAIAGNLYINDIHVNPTDLQGMTFEKVDIRIDAGGDIWIAAPGYKIEVIQPSVASPPPQTSASSPQYPPGAYGGAGAAVPPQPQPQAATSSYGPGAAGVAPLDPMVPQARWWLVTEDNGSGGHGIEVWVNDRLVETIRSGEPQRIKDIGVHLRRGANDVVIKSTSQNASGGSLYVYLGTGSDRSGTVVMDEPAVQFGIGSTRSGPYERRFTLNVQ